MSNPIDRQNGVSLPEVSIPSHQTALRAQLAATRVTMRRPLRRAALTAVTLCIAFAALTVAYPTWASDLVRFVKTGSKNVMAPDGKTYHQETYRMEGGGPSTPGMIRIQANERGEIVSHSEQAGVDPALQAMKDEAERAVQAGRARLLWEADGMKAYQVTLADSRTITYIQGPGTSWSISQ